MWETPVLGHISMNREAYSEVVGTLAVVPSSDLMQLMYGYLHYYRREVLELRLEDTMVPLSRRRY